MVIMDTFLKTIEAEPDNPAHKLAVADFLEERGEESLALAFRLAVERGYRIKNGNNDGVHYVWSYSSITSIELWNAIVDSRFANQDNWSLLDAFRRLAKALEKVGVPT